MKFSKQPVFVVKSQGKLVCHLPVTLNKYNTFNINFSLQRLSMRNFPHRTLKQC